LNKGGKSLNIKNILITGRIYEEVQVILNEKKLNYQFRYLPDNEVTKKDLHWADAFASFRPSPIFDLSHIKWVHSFGAGVDSFLSNHTWPENVLLTRTICSFGQKIGEYCLSYILRELQLHKEFGEFQSEKTWKPIAPRQLNEQTVFIYGTGVIGQEIAKLLHPFGVTVYGVSLSGKQKDFFNHVFRLTDEIPHLKKVNFIISTLPLTDLTFNMFDDKKFSTLAEAVFINVGRGATVKEDSLINALNEGHIKHAILDVFPEEPLASSNPLWERKDVTITPHISAITSPEEAVECFIETLTNIEANQPLKNRVDVAKGF
jgi:phosphoglycerate dehydrogenase-like enzyme